MQDTWAMPSKGPNGLPWSRTDLASVSKFVSPDERHTLVLVALPVFSSIKCNSHNLVLPADIGRHIAERRPSRLLLTPSRSRGLVACWPTVSIGFLEAGLAAFLPLVAAWLGPAVIAASCKDS